MIKDTTRLAIDALDGDGAGVGSAGGLRLHVPFALPSETVEATIEHRSPHRPDAWGRLRAVLVPSTARVEPACPAFGRCGGCALQHLDYGEQRAWKRRFVVEALARAGIAAEVRACVGLPGTPPLAYRNRSKLVFARQGDRVVLGAYAPRSHEVVDLAGCRVVMPPLNEIARAIADIATDLGVRVYDERAAEGDARYAILRAGQGGAVQVMLVVARRGVPAIRELARRLASERPAVAGVVENLQPSRGNALVGHVEPDVVLAGDPVLREPLGAARLQLSPRAFFQASWPMARALYEAAADAAALREGEVAVDLYCGVGGIALTLAAKTPAARVIGVEEIADAVDDARAGASQCGLSNATFVCGDAARLVAERAAARTTTDVVVVDPPRRGLTPAVVGALRALAPRNIVYVSCSPDTLARDLAKLIDGGGYALGVVTPFDLMPHTHHVETLAVLTRR